MNRRVPIDVGIADIAVVDRLHEPDPQAVAALSADIAERGLRQPIEITPSLSGNPWRLVSGAHRLAACASLGWAVIAAFEVRGTEDELRRDELLENLARSELSPMERAIFAAELRDIWLRANPEARHGGDRRSADFKMDGLPSWSAAAAERTGWGAATLQKAATIGGRLDREAVRLLRGTAIEHTQSDLAKLAQSPAAEQRRLASLVRERGIPRLSGALGAARGEAEAAINPDALIFTQFQRVWSRASDAAKTLIRDHIAGEEA